MPVEINVINEGTISGMSADNGTHRLVFDAIRSEMRLFSHYVNVDGRHKLKTIRVMPIEDLIERLAAEVEENQE